MNDNDKRPICEECDIEIHRYSDGIVEGWSCDRCGWSFDDDDNPNTPPVMNGTPKVTSNWKEPSFGYNLWQTMAQKIDMGNGSPIWTLSHQHLSNIYFAIATGFVVTENKDVMMKKFASYITQKFGHLESYKPQYDNEVEYLRAHGFVIGNDIIIGGDYQGSVYHLDKPELEALTTDEMADQAFEKLLPMLSIGSYDTHAQGLIREQLRQLAKQVAEANMFNGPIG